MPYIPKADRIRLRGGEYPRTAGELTYVFTYHCLQDYGHYFLSHALDAEINLFLDEQKKLDFATLCSVVGALQCARLEFRRRRPDDYFDADEALSEAQRRFYRYTVAPYENQKISENGDVFDA